MKYLFSFIFALVFAFSALAQQPDTVQVDVTKLTGQQLQVYQELKAMQARQAASTSLENLTPEKVDKYAQMGKGLGIAINEGLGAVTKNVEGFAQTSAGKWLMILITWKVMGADAIGLARTAVQWIVGGTLLFVGIPFWIWLVRRNCVVPPIAVIEKPTFWTKKKVYQNRLPIHEEYTWGYGLCFLIYLGAIAMITFMH